MGQRTSCRVVLPIAKMSSRPSMSSSMRTATMDPYGNPKPQLASVNSLRYGNAIEAGNDWREC
jgi:hypothetical protein